MNAVDRSTETHWARRRIGKWVMGAVLFVGVSSTLTWLAKRVQERVSLIQYFEQRGGQVTTKLLNPGWLNDAMPATVRNSLAEITTVSLQDTGVTDAAVDNLSSLTRQEFETLERLNLENTNVTDESLQHLSSLRNIQRLILENTTSAMRGWRTSAFWRL